MMGGTMICSMRRVLLISTCSVNHSSDEISPSIAISMRLVNGVSHRTVFRLLFCSLAHSFLLLSFLRFASCLLVLRKCQGVLDEPRFEFPVRIETAFVAFSHELVPVVGHPVVNQIPQKCRTRRRPSTAAGLSGSID